MRTAACGVVRATAGLHPPVHLIMCVVLGKAPVPCWGYLTSTPCLHGKVEMLLTIIRGRRRRLRRLLLPPRQCPLYVAAGSLALNCRLYVVDEPASVGQACLGMKWMSASVRGQAAGLRCNTANNALPAMHSLDGPVPPCCQSHDDYCAANRRQTPAGGSAWKTDTTPPQRNSRWPIITALHALQCSQLAACLPRAPPPARSCCHSSHAPLPRCRACA